MFEAIDWMVHPSFSSVLLVAVVIPLSLIVQKIVYNLYFHPLAAFPGPRVARVTRFWKAYVEAILNRSFVHVLEELHTTYGGWQQLWTRSETSKIQSDELRPRQVILSELAQMRYSKCSQGPCRNGS